MGVLDDRAEFLLEFGVEERFAVGEGGGYEVAKGGEAAIESAVSQQVADDLGSRLI